MPHLSMKDWSSNCVSGGLLLMKKWKTIKGSCGRKKKKIGNEMKVPASSIRVDTYNSCIFRKQAIVITKKYSLNQWTIMTVKR